MNATPSAPLMPAVGTRLASNRLGRIVSAADQTATWRHPWHTRPYVSGVAGKWMCQVKEGFVNGICPTIRTTSALLAESRRSFWGQLVDAHSGAAEIEQVARLADMSDDDEDFRDGPIQDIPLYRQPPIPLSQWSPVTHIPKYFQRLGAIAPPVELKSLETGQIEITEPPKGVRYLVSCDVWVQQPRVALSSKMDASAFDMILGTGIVSQSLTMRAPAADVLPHMVSGSFTEAQNIATDMQAATDTLSDFEEKNFDIIKVSTVYLLSPPDVSWDTPVGGDWAPYVAHAQYWNLAWYQPLLSANTFTGDIFSQIRGTLSVLGGGAAFLWASAITGSLNDAAKGAINVLQAASLRGSFWTPTGGGTAAMQASKDPGEPKYTLNKKHNAEMRRNAEYEEMLAERLDPPFPYSGKPFNTAFIR